MEIMSSSTTTTLTPFHLKQLYTHGKKDGCYYKFDFSNDERWDAMLKAVNVALQEVSQIPTLEINFVDRKSRWIILPMPLGANHGDINRMLCDFYLRIEPLTKNGIERHRLNNLKSQYPRIIVQAATHEKLLELEKKSADSSESKIFVNSTNVREVAGLIINTLNIGSGSSSIQAMCQSLSLQTDEEFNPKPTKKNPKPKPTQAFRNLQNYIVTQKRRSEKTKKNLKHLWADRDVRDEVRNHFYEEEVSEKRNCYGARFSFTKRFWDDGSFKQYIKYKLYGYYKFDRTDLEWLWVIYVDYKHNADNVWCEKSMLSFKEYLDQVTVPTEEPTEESGKESGKESVEKPTEYFTNFTTLRDYNISPGDLLRFCYDCLAKGKVSEELSYVNEELSEDV
jgi:hypothetical protein